MLITFKSKAHANILMFGEVGKKMLEWMGFGTRIPGAIDAGDVPAALSNLKKALQKIPQKVEPAGDAEEDQPSVSLHTRALPLIQLLEASVAEQEYVRWE